MIIKELLIPKASGGGDWVRNPSQKQIESAFDRDYARMGDIWAMRDISTDPNLSEPTDKDTIIGSFSIGIETHKLSPDDNGHYNETPYAFIYRLEPYPVGQGGMLIWDPTDKSTVPIELEDAGGATWKLNTRHSVPIAFAVDFVTRFLTNGYVGEDLTWGR